VVPHKGVHVLVEAAAAASVPVELDVFGRVYDPAYARDLEERADASPEVRLTLHGPYEDAAVSQVLAAVDAVVVPSQVPEVYPLVAYEALAHGVPLLADSLGGLPEAVDVGANGFTFDASRPDELAAILRRLHGDRELVARLRAGAASTEVVSSTEHVEAMRAVYAELAAAGTSGNGGLEELDRLHERLVGAGFATAY
jgi:glycosyltransferase involved in cell wall biosynthesis